jgi:hypothetical protein
VDSSGSIYPPAATSCKHRYLKKKSAPRFFGYEIPLQPPLTYVDQPKAPTVNVGYNAFITANNHVYRMATEGNTE